MWWQSTLENATGLHRRAGPAFGKTGLAFYMIRLGKTAALQVQADFVNHIVLPHFYLFAPIVYGLKVLTAASLILGLFVRFWGSSAHYRQSICGSVSITTITHGRGLFSSSLC